MADDPVADTAEAEAESPGSPMSPPRYDWTPFLDYSRTQLVREYVDCATALANLIDEVAFLRNCETRDKTVDRTVRVEQEAARDVLIEKKWMITRLLEFTHNGAH